MFNPFRFLTGRKTASNGPVSDKASARPVSFHVTLWPAFDHFPKFAADPRLQGIRLNSAMMAASEIDDKFVRRASRSKVPLWFDIKGMQLRIKEAWIEGDHYEFILNRPVQCATPFPVWFKAGEDAGLCVEVRDGTHFILAEGAKHGPQNQIKAGESIHIKRADLVVGGPTFLDYEIEKIEKVKSLGFNRYCLSYVYDQRHVDEFRELVGPDAHVYLKIENEVGLEWVANHYKPQPHTNLFAARGDMYIEVARPSQILGACKLIIERDPDALVGSRMLLSLVKDEVPACSDLFELLALYQMGYRTFLLCDELCLKDEWLSTACAVFEEFRKEVGKL